MDAKKVTLDVLLYAGIALFVIGAGCYLITTEPLKTTGLAMGIIGLLDVGARYAIPPIFGRNA
jgi:hypothetical protein